MSSAPERRRPRKATFLALAAFGFSGALAFACGFDSLATKDTPVPGADADDDHTVVLPPEGGPIPEAGMPDAPLDSDAEAGCPTGHGAMVMLDAGGLTFCIDSTEVTNGEYDKFIAATDGGLVDSGVFDAGSPDGCGTNASYQINASGSSNFPVVNANWCDAHAYCAWAGKRLCGKTADADASTGEWYNACSNGGARLYPYGSAFVANACNDNTGGTLAVGSKPLCEGGVPGLFDMVGNVSEFIDSCSAGSCATVGGSFATSGDCTASSPLSVLVPASFVGFRCCGDLH